jgi:hypothetical protein
MSTGKQECGSAQAETSGRNREEFTGAKSEETEANDK